MVKNLPTMQQTRVQFLGGEKSPGEGNGNPVQHSWLVNSMDRGAWRATVHGVANSWTWLSNFHFLFIYLHSLAYYLLLSCKYPLISSPWLLIHWKGKPERADSKHLFSRVSGKIFATSAELYVYRNVCYSLRENINKSTHLKEVCANRRVQMRRLNQLTNSIKCERGILIPLVIFWICLVFSMIQNSLSETYYLCRRYTGE